MGSLILWLADYQIWKSSYLFLMQPKIFHFGSDAACNLQSKCVEVENINTQVTYKYLEIVPKYDILWYLMLQLIMILNNWYFAVL